MSSISPGIFFPVFQTWRNQQMEKEKEVHGRSPCVTLGRRGLPWSPFCLGQEEGEAGWCRGTGLLCTWPLNVSGQGQDSTSQHLISPRTLGKVHHWRMGPMGAGLHQLSHLSSASYYNSFSQEKWFPSGRAGSNLLLYLLAIGSRRKLHPQNSLATLKGHLSRWILPFRCALSISNFSNGSLIILAFGLSRLLCMKHLFGQSSKRLCIHWKQSVWGRAFLMILKFLFPLSAYPHSSYCKTHIHILSI